MISGRRSTQRIGDILSDLFARRGLARLRAQQELEDVWRRTIGSPGDKYTRLGRLRRGVLEILVANSVLLQELAGFQKQQLLEKLREQLDSPEINDLRFRLDDGI